MPGLHSDNTKSATGAKLAANGSDLGQAITGGIPFPIPAKAADAAHALAHGGVGRTGQRDAG